ncbi:deoxyribosyltransferase superfamily protein [Proteus phage Privateer]|uniref:Deoxyribosyltransferase superfamily protein n=1 Tax=Proteus phage Privateer TaxID=2712958 RepID=A0A6G8R3Q4_9CAUD|nr:nucleoside 2-deoxyribosyltransferase [Proteus phage Privateer]QIN94829.1 deoxyribosyltransferase superfamily protein [Proteus phage Privateer]
MKKVYIAGHCLTVGSQLQRNQEKEMIHQLGHELYNPMDNKEINDKKNAVQEGLAERIVKHDTDAIMWADTILIEPLPEALGTHVELGQIKGMKDLSLLIDVVLKDDDIDSDHKLRIIKKLTDKILDKEVIAHYGDIRRVKGITESEDRRSLGINQYVYGTVLQLTNGKGFTEQEDLREAIGTAEPF